MPPPSYEKTRTAKLDEAWDLLQGSPEWEIAERRDGARLLLGQPPIRRRRGMTVGGIAVKSSAATEGEYGVEVETPSGPAGASWVATEQDARVEFEARLASFNAQTTGEEKLYRVKLVIGGNVVDTRSAAVGEITPNPVLLDALSLTYLGVLATIALTVAINVDGLGIALRVLVGLGVFFGLGLLLRARPVRRFVLGIAHGALGGPDDRQR